MSVLSIDPGTRYMGVCLIERDFTVVEEYTWSLGYNCRACSQIRDSVNRWFLEKVRPRLDGISIVVIEKQWRGGGWTMNYMEALLTGLFLGMANIETVVVPARDVKAFLRRRGYYPEARGSNRHYANKKMAVAAYEDIRGEKPADSHSADAYLQALYYLDPETGNSF